MKFKIRTTLAMAAGIGATAYIFGSGLTISSAWLITMASMQPPVLVLQVAIVLVRFFGIARSVSRYGERIMSHEAVFSSLTESRATIFSSLSRNISTTFTSSEELTKTIVDDVERAEEFHLRVHLPYIMALIAGAIGLLVALWISPIVSIWLIPGFVMYSVVIPWMSRRFSDSLSRDIEVREDAFARDLARTSETLVEAEILGFAARAQSTLASGASEITGIEKKLAARNSYLQAISISVIGLTIVGVSFSMHHGSHHAVTVAMALFAPLVIFEAFTMWFPNLFTSGKYRSASEKIHSYKDGSAVIEPHLSPVSFNLQVKDACAFWTKPFTRKLTFSAHPGDVIEIRGRSGSGKSTLAAALFGFAKYEGSISIGGIELRDVHPLHDVITGSLQKSHIFNTSLLENLKLAKPNATPEEIARVIEIVELQDIALEELLGEFGRNLSGGEVKRVAIARALLSPAPITLLDEPLEHLDSERAARIAKKVNEYSSSRILLVISHTQWPDSTQILQLHRE